MNQHKQLLDKSTFTFALRVVVGWTYFSALWRRFVLADKLDPDSLGYIGIKFNHFLPHALGIKPIIEYMVSHPDVLWWNMLIFTLIEGIVGLFIIFGLFTRLMSIGVMGLALGILLGSGWLGTTCLDEWQIGILGIASGFALFLGGGGQWSLDHKISQKRTLRPWVNWISSGELYSKSQKPVLIGSIIIIFISLYTNQAFHGGIFGHLHNLSVKPNVEIINPILSNDELSFSVYRTDGVDVYGSYLIGVQLINSSGKIEFEMTAEELALMNQSDIENEYIAQVKPGKHSLIIPLGAKALLHFREAKFSQLPHGSYTLKLIDISGVEWINTINK